MMSAAQRLICPDQPSSASCGIWASNRPFTGLRPTIKVGAHPLLHGELKKRSCAGTQSMAFCLQVCRKPLKQNGRPRRRDILSCSSEPPKGTSECTRRQMHALLAASAGLASLSRSPGAQALTLADVTPEIAPPVPLSARCEVASISAADDYKHGCRLLTDILGRVHLCPSLTKTIRRLSRRKTWLAILHDESLVTILHDESLVSVLRT